MAQHKVDDLRAWLEAQPDLSACLIEAKQNPREEQILYLRSTDPTWLNLPWRLAVVDLPNVHLVATPVADELPHYESSIPLPFRILVMISSPVDQEASRKLDYEKEEYQIIHALSPLIEQGLVHIEFTEDGSLEALQRKLSGRSFHALHFIGHGNYHQGQGVLELEEPGTLNRKVVNATEIVEALHSEGIHTPPLVVLSACKTAQGREAADQEGVAYSLIREGIPSVIAMNESIRDDYAILFASRLYQYIAQGETLPASFKIATEAIRGAEAKEYQNKRTPSQWLIPELIVSQQVQRIIDTKGEKETLVTEGSNFKLTEAGVVLSQQSGRAFVGRRKERSELLSALNQHRPVLLLGMGGVGKTALAAHLLHGLSLQSPQLQLLIFNEITFTPSRVFERLLDLLPEPKRNFTRSQLATIHETQEQMKLLLDSLRFEEIRVAFVFDNLETFQSGPGQPFQEAYADQESILKAVAQQPIFPVILTARYPLSGLQGIDVRDIHQSSLNDFWKCSLHTNLYQTYLQFNNERDADLQQKISPDSGPITYLAFIRQLHTLLGGNYRLLEYFDGIMRERPEALQVGWSSLEALQPQLAEARGRMESDETGRRLAFGELMVLLGREERFALQLLSHFRIPVQESALRMQQDSDHMSALTTLVSMTLIEQQEPQPGRTAWYAVPLVKDYLEAQPVAEVDFSQEMAGRYYEDAVDNLPKLRLQQEEAFYHYCLAGNKERVNEIGDQLCKFYYEKQLFAQSLHYGRETERLLGEKTQGSIWNVLGLVFETFGKLDPALAYQEKSLLDTQQRGDRKGEGVSLNNIGQIFNARGDHSRALGCLGLSLQIRREIGDKLGEGITLNIIGQIYSARGDNETALQHLEQSLRIMREIGDRQGEGKALNNLSLIYSARGDYETALRYLGECLVLIREIGTKKEEGTTLNNLGHIFNARGDYETALGYLEESLRIEREIGDKKGEGTTLNNISQIYDTRGDYNTALGYLKQSLRIQREIEDKSGEGITLNNIGQIYNAHADYDTGMEYLQNSLRIRREIGDKSGEGATLNNISLIFSVLGDYETALRYLEQSMVIQLEVDDINGLAISLWNMGDIFIKQGNNEAAIEPIFQAYTIFDKIGSPRKDGTIQFLNAIIEQIGEARFQEIIVRLQAEDI